MSRARVIWILLWQRQITPWEAFRRIVKGIILM